jgi:hypothetical protein
MKIFGPMRGKGIESCIKLYSVQLYKFYSSNIVTVIRSRRIRWVGHVTHMGERRSA